MKREIKFRCWSEEQNKFISGYPLGYETKGGFNISGISEDGEQEMEEDGLKIMQYTGLKDKNSKDIYEGDILFADRKTNKIGKVIFDGGCFIIDFGNDSNFIATKNGFEIIGNIYENPELITNQP